MNNQVTNSKAVNLELSNCEVSNVESKRKSDLTSIITVGLFIVGFVLISALCAFKVIVLPAGF